ncbi:MAG: EAL domain-containing protein [Aquificae bacterium]|nr:EAL domain-containing protein [Aquificota bacterium]
MVKPKSISGLTYWGALGLLTLAFLFFVVFNFYKEYRRYRLNLNQLKEAVINERKEMLAANMREMISLVHFQESLLEDHLKNRLKDEVNIVVGIFGSIYNSLKDRVPEAELQNALLNSVRGIRTSDGRGYFFITRADNSGIVLVNPAFPEIENNSMWNYQDVYGKFVQREFLHTVKKYGGGFVEYYWYLPDSDKLPSKKIAYVKLFKPFDWIVGSGDYVEFLREEMKRRFALTLSQHELPKSKVSIIVFDYITDTCISEKKVCSRFSFLKNHLREGFLRLNNTLFFIHKCPIWRIYIASAYSLKDIESELTAPISMMKSAMIKDLAFSTGIGLVFYLFMFLMTRRFLNLIRTQEEEVKKKEYRALKESRKLFRQVYTDPITGLPNRNKFNVDLGRSKSASVGLFNIDRFREINDVFGYDFGDKVLKTVGNIIKREARSVNPNLRVYRISGDEFVVADLKKSLSKSAFRSLIQKIVDRLNTTIIKDQSNAVNVSVSAGVVLNDENPLSKADVALAEAKKNADRSVVVYSDIITTLDHYRENMIWVDRIRSALIEDRIVPYFQPIVNNKTGEVVKYEVLARLIDRDGRVYTPAEFLEISRRYKLYPEISRRIIRKTAQVIKEKGVNLSINISLSDILNIEVRNFILKTIRETGIGDRLTFEILEDESIEGSYDVMEFISSVKMYGVRIAIDDFGRGYSNFAYLTKLAVDVIKIDGSLIRDINRDKTHRAVVKAIVTFARKSGIKTVAEFVETEEIFETVKSLGIDCSQGYYIGKPSPEILDKS